MNICTVMTALGVYEKSRKGGGFIKLWKLIMKALLSVISVFIRL